MESVILTFHIQGRRGKAKLPPLPQDLRDALERCLRRSLTCLGCACVTNPTSSAGWMRSQTLPPPLNCGRCAFSAAAWNSIRRAC